MKTSTLEKMMKVSRNRFKISDERILMGATKNKFPVLLRDGKTIVYISDESKAEETRIKYELIRKGRAPIYTESYIS
jgi:hypothetical protein